MYFDLNSAFDLVHCRLSDKLSIDGLFIGYINWFWKYLTKGSCYVWFYGVLSHHFYLLCLGFRKVLFWDVCCHAHTHTVMVCVAELKIVFFSLLVI
jgi:hypothetical protein